MAALFRSLFLPPFGSVCSCVQYIRTKHGGCFGIEPERQKGQLVLFRASGSAQRTSRKRLTRKDSCWFVQICLGGGGVVPWLSLTLQVMINEPTDYDFCAWFGRYDRVIWSVKGSCVPTGTIGPSSSRGSGSKKRVEDWLILPAESAKAARMT